MDQKLVTTMQTNAAKAALQYVPNNQIIGIGTGNTVNCFIEQLAASKHKIVGAVASSAATAKKLKALNIALYELNDVEELAIYIDGADAYNSLRELVKGGGGALTKEKILANASKQFICIVDSTKQPDVLGNIPVPVEVLPMARSYVARELVKLGGQPEYRDSFVTDNGNIILDVRGWQIAEPIALEEKINHIAGVVSNGIFAARRADKIIIGYENTTKEI